MPEELRHYRSIDPVTVAEAEEAFKRNEPDELRLLVIGVGLYCDDLPWAEAYCLRLTEHLHYNVRGNSILALAHLARRFRTLVHPQSIDVIRCGLSDENEYVRQHANDAADDIEHYMKIEVRLDVDEK